LSLAQASNSQPVLEHAERCAQRKHFVTDINFDDFPSVRKGKSTAFILIRYLSSCRCPTRFVAGDWHGAADASNKCGNVGPSWAGAGYRRVEMFEMFHTTVPTLASVTLSFEMMK